MCNSDAARIALADPSVEVLTLHIPIAKELLAEATNNQMAFELLCEAAADEVKLAIMKKVKRG